ncbi:hypothetical protein [Planctopirus hydrillae]|uniref:Alkyl hydroperoxide reductase subunit C/ Thiol specific antioxidant domain-containing protein n=1 Tax=Planctopirus hydrillae TaxID=1841610 RepID=A0A1C3ECT2_9PLAN|nr:hypothetical protein [Planctopirus hydrillae]ODA31041.1 hypothetical protein A6X21_22890 [Planctopirus hydrillae]
MIRDIVVLLAIAGVIAAICWWRSWQTITPQKEENAALWKAADKPSSEKILSLKSTPRFEGIDQQNRMFRLDSILGRHEIYLLFVQEFDAPGSRAALEALKRMARVTSSPAKVRSNTAWEETQLVVVTTSLPPIVRAELENTGKFGGTILSDATGEIRRLWNVSDFPTLFHINRASQARHELLHYNPEDQPENSAAIEQSAPTERPEWQDSP